MRWVPETLVSIWSPRRTGVSPRRLRLIRERSVWSNRARRRVRRRAGPFPIVRAVQILRYGGREHHIQKGPSIKRAHQPIAWVPLQASQTGNLIVALALAARHFRGTSGYTVGACRRRGGNVWTHRTAQLSRREARRSTVRVGAAAVCAVSVLGIVGCGGRGSSSSAATGPTLGSSTTVANVTTTTVVVGTAGSVHILATSSGGDAATASLSISKPVPVNSANVSAASGCTNIDLTRAMAVRVDATVTLTSSLSTQVTLGFSEGNAPQYLSGDQYFAATYPTGDSCQIPDTGRSDENRQVAWNHMAPDSPQSFTAWFILANAITPNSPQGDPKVLDNELFTPDITFNGVPATEQLGGDAVVHCSDGTLVVMLGPSRTCPG